MLLLDERRQRAQGRGQPVAHRSCCWSRRLALRRAAPTRPVDARSTRSATGRRRSASCWWPTGCPPLMVLLTALLGLAALVFSLARWHRAGPALPLAVPVPADGPERRLPDRRPVQPVRVLRAAARRLVRPRAARLGTRRACARACTTSSINLAASLLFLVGVSLIYGVAGTLNMADLAVRLPQVAGGDRALLRGGRRDARRSHSSSRPACGRSASGCRPPTPRRARRRRRCSRS